MATSASIIDVLLACRLKGKHMTENNISDRGGLESRYTVEACDVIIKWHPELAEKYESDTERKRLLGLFLETFDDLGSEVIFYYNMQDGDNTIL